MAGVQRFADVEQVLIDWLSTNLGLTCMDELPYDMVFELPAIVVSRFSGADEQWVLDKPRVDVDVYAGTRAVAKQVSEQIRGALRFQLRNAEVPGGLITQVFTVAGPAQRPWDSKDLRRFGASYQVILKARAI